MLSKKNFGGVVCQIITIYKTRKEQAPQRLKGTYSIFGKRILTTNESYYNKHLIAC